MKFNKEEYIEKVYACWQGKNIGGTMGTPYEHNTDMQDISGFSSEKGAPAANDDLDLQLMWLCAIEERGIKNITSKMLAEYWISFIPPQWNEYGVAKSNLKIGLMPPYSGEHQNDLWKTSNGAWIRTEIWATLFPGYPELAVKYAYKDACVDHGLSEGTHAAMFVAALESSAFIESDIMKLIDMGLSFIPSDSKTAKAVKLAIELHKQGASLKEAREKIVEFNSDLGWFQAPANIAFVILGLLYGEGDFKKSMIYAIDCGDDTDCTGATIGSIMGIIGGKNAIPDDWAEYIGDSIVSFAIDLSYLPRPRSCQELTDRVLALLPQTLSAYGISIEETDGHIERGDEPAQRIAEFDIPENPYTYEETDLIHTLVRIQFETAPVIKPNQVLKMKAQFLNTMWEPRTLFINLLLPDGWSADYQKSVFVEQKCEMHTLKHSELEFEITAGENVDSVNEIIMCVTADGRPTRGMLPITVLG